MKKFSLFMLAALLVLGGLPGAVMAEEHELPPGTLVKGSGDAVYYLDEDLTRHVFPNGRIFKSWFENFDDVVEISDEELSEYPLAGNVPYKPGKLLVKLTTDPKTYAVDEGGVLRWVKNERVARALYGDNWNQFVQDLSDAFFVDYEVGDDIDNESEFDENRGQKVKRLVKTLREKRLKRLKRRGADSEDLEHRGFGRNKVAVCHNFGDEGEHTIFIATPALNAHLNHGDEEGRCAGDQDDDDGDEDEDEDDGDDEEQDETAPTILSSSVGSITHESAVISVTTDEDVTAVVHSGTTTPVDTSGDADAESTTLSDAHDLTLEGLEAEKTYRVLVIVTDAAGNETTSSELSFTTDTTPDTTAPSFESRSVDSATATAATVLLTADEDVTAVVHSATSSPVATDGTPTAESDTLQASHEIELTGLEPETTYFVVIVIEDGSGNTATSTELEVTTPAL